MKLGEVLKTTSGGTPSRSNSNYYTGSIPWVKSGELNQNTILETEEHISEEAVKNSSAKIFPKGTLLIALYGATIGKLAFLGINAATNQAVCGIFKNEGIESKFLYYFLFHNRRKLVEKGAGGAQPNISQTILKNLPIVIAPLPEQRAIVARIEELFSELDHSISNLNSAQAKLEIYRQAVLKKAFEGGFTEEWRKTNSSISGEEIIGQIKIEQKKWIDIETIKGNSEAKRLKSKLNKVKSTFSEFKELPPSWTWTTILESSNLVVDCHNKTAPYEKDGVFLIRTTNVKNGRLNLLSGIRFVSQKTFDYWSRRCVPESGDLLFTREAPMGEIAIIPENTQVCLGQRMMLFRVFNDFLEKRYLYYAIQDPLFQERMDKSAIGTGVKHLRVGDVENLSFPICSPSEQIQIVQEIESRLSVADKMAETIRTSLQKAEALRQSILKKAFEGKLLTEAELEACRKEADWEPAEKLFERIKSERKK
ncbi:MULTISPECIES: restriction endonuclease subunit S [Rhodonellum]|uniref:restriction endonuclease subunit S n=1 Tax=Rhodonellum TaxID=336827 RepID=UPI0013786185|nr:MULTISPECIES: restriction endonuclease subunit S [Rhodonellum]